MPLRIISGEWRRRLLKTPDSRSTRPYTDRVRQIVFDRMREVVPDARVADVFSGVGTMGLEALSRGAASCVFFEADRETHRLLRENVQSLIDERPWVCWRTDVTRTSFRPKGADHCLPYSLIFFDPPYAHAEQLEERQPLWKSISRLARPDVSTDGARLLLRTPLKTRLGSFDGWDTEDRWEISTMAITVLRKPGSDSNDENAALDHEPEEENPGQTESDD